MTKRYDKAHFIVYSNNVEPFTTNGDAYCASALQAGFDSATHHTEEALRDTPFWTENAGILEQERGAGYWLWKPYLLLETLRSVGPNDVVVYNDIGRYQPGSFIPFPRFPHAAINLTALTPQRFLHGFITDWMTQRHYTKRDCFIGLDADTHDMHRTAQVTGCPLFYMPSDESFAFLERWLAFAKDPHILTDLPDEKGDPLPDFQDHRHDMAISSILLHQTRGAYLDLSKTGGFSFAEDIRRRNRHVPRAQTHAGYMSLMIERALPDDFFMRANPDLSEARHIVRNLTEDDGLPLHEMAPARATLAEEFLKMLRIGQIGISQGHLSAVFSDNKVIGSKIHALSKLPKQDTVAFWAEAVDHANKAAQAHVDSGAEITDTTPFDIAANALHKSEQAFPDLRTEMMVGYVWGALNEDARGLFKSQHRNIKSPKGREAMRSFIRSVGHDTVLTQDRAIAGRAKEESERVSQTLIDWLVAADTPQVPT